jgi:hypothetical protein
VSTACSGGRGTCALGFKVATQHDDAMMFNTLRQWFGRALAEFPVPGETQVELPAGTVHVEYWERAAGRHQESGHGDRWRGPPNDLRIEIRPAGGGDPLSIDPSSYCALGTARSIGVEYGAVSVPEPGPYTIVVPAFGASKRVVEPRLKLKR